MNLKLDQFIGVSENDMNLYNEITDIFIGAQSEAHALQQQISSIEMLYSVAQHIRKFGITEENRELFAASFEQIGVSYSYEGVISTAYNSVKNMIEKIIKFLKEKAQAFFKKLKEWYNRIFRKKVQDASKEPLPKEKEAEFNKKMTEGGSSSKPSNEGVADTSFKDVADELDIIHGDKMIPVDDIVDIFLQFTKFLKGLDNNIKSGNYTAPPEPEGPNKLATPSQGGWADPNKLLKLIEVSNQLSDIIDDLIVDVPRIGRSLVNKDIENKREIMDLLKSIYNRVGEAMRYNRLIVILVKKAMEVRENIMKDQIPD